ncbi:MAG: hypothetical protein ACFFDQ_07825 [Candidatus Thorarchaeota archaeon]
MPKNKTGFLVQISRKEKENEYGTLYYTETGPAISLNDGTILEDTKDIRFRIVESMQANDLLTKLEIYYRPLIIARFGYTLENIRPEIMYPPSTNGWLSHVVLDHPEAMFTVHEVRDSDKKLLIIVDAVSKEILNSHLVQPFETSILKMKQDWVVHDEIFMEQTKPQILDILNSEPPTWELLSRLLQDVSISNLSIKKTMGETLDQLVPQSFPENARRQIMAFLAWIQIADIPKIDPLEFNQKYRSVSIFRQLAAGHIRCLIDEVKPPPYVRLMIQADKGLSKMTHRPQSEVVEQNPLNAIRLKLYELYPDWTGSVVEYAKSLNEKEGITIELPISKIEAKKSKHDWKDRFAMVTQGLIVRGHVQKDALGLKTMVYIGGAHKWPHKHLQYSARLSYESEKQPYLQVLTVPVTATEQVIRLVPSIHLIDWEMSKFNLELYSSQKRKWSMNVLVLRKSLERSRSLAQLMNEFGKWAGSIPVSLTRKDSVILDIISWGIYLGSANYNKVLKYYGVSKQSFDSSLKKLIEQKVILPQYFFSMEKLRSICLVANGEPSRICSLARSFLKNVPSSNVMISNGGESCHIVARIPEDIAFNFITDLPKIASENEITLRALPISAYAGYVNDLYQRLWLRDGVWDDDVTGLISQIRLRPKENE